MFRFILGVAVGGVGMYWMLTGQIPWRDEVESWFSRAASSYTAQEHHREARNVIVEPSAAPASKR
jgi:hypothetical protein